MVLVRCTNISFNNEMLDVGGGAIVPPLTVDIISFKNEIILWCSGVLTFHSKMKC